MKGVSLEFLIEWSVEYPQYTTLQVCEKVKLKTCKGDESASYITLLEEASPEHVGPATLYLCHCWSSNFHNTITSIHHYFTNDPKVKPENTFVWIDVLCVNQHLEASEELSLKRIEETKRIVQKIGRTIVALGDWDVESDNIVLSRAWCIWELYCTDPDNLLVAMTFKEKRAMLKDLQSNPTSVIERLHSSESCEVSEATEECDMTVLHDTFLSSDNVDSTVKAHLFRWAAETAWGYIIEQQKHVEREFDEKRKPNTDPKRKSLRNLLRTQAIFLRDVTEAFKTCKAYQYAIELFLGILREHERFKGQVDYDKITAINYSNLADIFGEKCNYGEAVEYYRKALAINRKLEPTLIPDTLNGIANNLWLMGKKQEAEELYDEIITLDRQSCGREKTSRAKRCLVTSLLNMGNHLEEIDLARAVPYLEEACQIAVDLYEEDESEETLTELRGLASICQRLGEYDKAAQNYSTILTLQEIFKREEDALVVDIDEDGLLDEDLRQSASDLYSYATCVVEGRGENPDAVLKDAAQCCRAALGLNMKYLGPEDEQVIADLKLLCMIEELRGNMDRVQVLREKVDTLCCRFNRNRMRSGPLVELEKLHHGKLEKQLPSLLEGIAEDGNYKQVASVLEELSEFYQGTGTDSPNAPVKSIAYLCEGTRLKLLSLGKISKTGSSKYLVQPLTNDVRANLIRLFQLFSAADKVEALVKHCSNFVKMVDFFYQAETQSDNVILALNQYGLLLHEIKRFKDARDVFEKALGIADNIYDEDDPNPQWIGLLENASATCKVLVDYETCVKLQEKILRVRLKMTVDDHDRSKAIASDMYKLAAIKMTFANSVDDKEVVDKMLKDARLLLEKCIKDLKRHQAQEDVEDDSEEEDDNFEEENVVILRRALADVYVRLGELEKAQVELTRVVEANKHIFDEDDESLESDKEKLNFVVSSIKQQKQADRKQPVKNGNNNQKKAKQENEEDEKQIEMKPKGEGVVGGKQGLQEEEEKKEKVTEGGKEAVTGPPPDIPGGDNVVEKRPPSGKSCCLIM